MNNLSSLAIPYFNVPPSILRLSTRLSILAAIELYSVNAHGMETLLGSSRYNKEQRSTVLRELEDKNVTLPNGERFAFEWKDTKEPRIQLPMGFTYSDLPLAELKVFIAFENMGKYSEPSRWRTSRFILSCTHKELMTVTGLSKSKVVSAIQGLESRNLVKVQREYKKPSTYWLLDPEGSGVKRIDMAMHYRRRWDGFTVAERFALMFDSNITAPSLDQGNRTWVMTCPYCHKPKKFRVSVLDDKYECHGCGVKGDSERLYVKWLYGKKREWTKTLSFLPKSYAPEQDQHEGEEYETSSRSI